MRFIESQDSNKFFIITDSCNIFIEEVQPEFIHIYIQNAGCDKEVLASYSNKVLGRKVWLDLKRYLVSDVQVKFVMPEDN